ncbi:MAG: sec-independent protein translocase protein TatB [Methylobacteriaceae bacterium]|jgi:sec-independent protein translocase protein TatB|nr:sec-independent protein translocase protein TatB [Methylobacteriaceae bacterium]
MFDFDAGKLIVIGVVALIVIGPKELPRVLRQLGQAYSKMRRMAADFQGQFMDAMREAELDDIKKDLQAVGDAAKIDVNFNPVADIKQQVTSAIDGEPKAITSGEVPAIAAPHGEGSLNSIEMPELAAAAQGELELKTEGAGPPRPSALAEPPDTQIDAERPARLESAADPVPEQTRDPVPLKAANG